MSLEEPTQASTEAEATDEQAENEVSTGEVNNFVRGNDGAALLISEMVQGEPVHTLFLTVDRTYFRLKAFGGPAKVKRHTMASALESAKEAENKTFELVAYGQVEADESVDIDIERGIEQINESFETEFKDPNAGFGLSRDELDDQAGEVPVDLRTDDPVGADLEGDEQISSPSEAAHKSEDRSDGHDDNADYGADEDDLEIPMIKLEPGELLTGEITEIERNAGKFNNQLLTIDSPERGLVKTWSNKTIDETLAEAEAEEGDTVWISKSDDQESFTKDGEVVTYYPYEVRVNED